MSQPVAPVAPPAAETPASPAPLRRGLPASEHRLLLVAGDVLVSVAAVTVALALWSITAGFPLSFDFMQARAYWLVAALFWAFALAPARRVRVAYSVAATLHVIGRAAAALLVVYFAVYFYAPRQSLPRLMALHVVWQASLLTLAWRLLYVWIFTHPAFRRRLLVVGTGRAARTLLDYVGRAGVPHVEVVGVVKLPGGEAPVEAPPLDLPVVGTAADLPALARTHAVSEVVLALDGRAPAALVQALVGCQEDGVEVAGMASLCEELFERVPLDLVDADWVVTTFVEAVRMQRASHAAKRLVDLAGALVACVGLAVVFPLVAAAIWLDSGRPVLFRQVRVGQGGRPFWLLKFRTMVPGAEVEGEAQWAAEHDPRATRVGRWLRRARLDELPQVVSVLRGEMSLVGPRPERPEFVAKLEREISFYRMRHMVRPGLTGWAQVNHPYGDSVADARAKLEYDLYYIKHRSLLFDARVAARTLATVVRLGGR